METGAPSVTKVVTMIVFALSCVGLLLFLWLSFGGTIPFNPQGYRIRIAFPYADQLATQADVRIAGVSVGKVVGKSLDRSGNRTIATIQMDNQFAPIHRDARAILREKTILGETYVALTPGTPGSPELPDGGLLAASNVQPAVQLGQIFDTFDPRTRNAFQSWQQQLAQALRGNDQNLNSTLGNLPAFAADASDVLQVLDIEHTAVVRLVQNGGTTFAALSHDQGALRNLITSAEATFATTAANNNALAATFHVFPTFLNETKATTARLKTFALDTDPLVKELEPVALDLGPTLHSVRVLSPDLRKLFVNLGPLITASKTGLPAIRDVLHGTTPLLASLGPFLEQLNPILNWLSLHQQLTSDFITLAATASAATTHLIPNETGTGHYLRAFAPVNLGAFTNPATTPNANTRGNTYPAPLWQASPLHFSAGGKFPGSFTGPAWDCNNTGAPADGAKPVTKNPNGSSPPLLQACWVAPILPGAKPNQIPHLLQAHYPSR